MLVLIAFGRFFKSTFLGDILMFDSNLMIVKLLYEFYSWRKTINLKRKKFKLSETCHILKKEEAVPLYFSSYAKPIFLAPMRRNENCNILAR